MDWMMTLVSALVTLLLLGPLAVVAFTMFALVAAGLFLPASPTVAHATFVCPFSLRRVTAAFLSWAGAERPVDTVSCSAFRDPRQIRCEKQCLGRAEAHWAPSPLFPRFALLAGGVALAAESRS